MMVSELVATIRSHLIMRVSAKTIRDSFGYGKLFESVIRKINQQLVGHELALGSSIRADQRSSVLLYDDRKESAIRKLLDAVSRIQNNGEVSSRDIEGLRRAAMAFAAG